MLNEQLQKIGIPQPNLSELYSDIILSDDEKKEIIDKALFEARYAKHAAIQSELYWQKITAPIEIVKHTSTKLFTFLQMTTGVTIDSDNEEIVKLLCDYFSEDPSFEEKGYSLKKGLLLFGGVGVGKTFLMQTFKNNQKQSYQVVSCQDVEATYAKNGDDRNKDTGAPGLNRFYGLLSLNSRNQYGQNDLGFLFDDLGQENTTTKYFGTERNVMIEVLSQRYRYGLFDSTHITTNLSADQIKDVYGIRVADRMKEMFNLISFPENAQSRRK